MTRATAIERLRNIGIIAHIDAGKTTVSERILVATGRLRAPGEVHDGQAALDFDAQERKRGITISAAATSVRWRGHQINLIDTPGHVDFTVEVERSLRVLDGGVVVFDAVAGVEPQSETVWRQADRYGVPRIGFVNKMDRPGADLERTVAMIRERLGATAVAVQLPVVVDGELRGVVDLLSGELVDFAGDGRAELSPQLAEAAAAARQALVEAAAEADDELLAAYLDGQPITALALRAALRRATLAGRLVPVLCGSALRSRGISQLLDAVVDYLPSPLDMRAERPADPAAPLVAFVFKVVSDVHIGQLSYVRVYSGTLTAGSYVLNATRGVRERVGRVLRVHADELAALPAVAAGDIAALVGPRQSVTGDTLCDPAAPVVLASIELPEPVIRLAIEPRSSADRDRLSAALQRLAVADPTFHVGVDAETGQTVVAGMGELHLEVQLERLRLDHGVEVRAGQPEVAYRETIRRAVEVEHTLARQSGGGSGQWARVRLRLEPLERGAGFAFAEEVVGGAVPRQFIPAVEAGVRDALGSGVRAGYPATDLRATLVGGAFHPVDSSELAFRTAAAQAFREAMRQAEPLLLEPLMRVEVVAPDEYLGAVLGDLGGRRGQVVGTEPVGGAQLVRALVPLAALFGYSGALRSLSQGRASFSMELAAYGELPTALTAEVVVRSAR